MGVVEGLLELGEPYSFSILFGRIGKKGRQLIQSSLIGAIEGER